MTNEEYKNELIRMFDSLRKDYKGEDSCLGVTNCEQCPFRNGEYTCNDLTAFDAFQIVEIVTKWSKEHPRPKYKVSQMEYDILCTALDYNSAKDTIFDDFYMLNDLLEKGYFKGATLETNVGDYFDNCEVVDK